MIDFSKHINNTEEPPIKEALFSTAYLPPISYFIEIADSNKSWIEAHENFNKQSYRNRCQIMTANGVETLTIPVESNNGKKQAIKEVKIAQHDKWQVNHWRALQSSYNSSPFFEYYADDFRWFYEKKWHFLWDYNWELLTLITNLIGLENSIEKTSSYKENWDETLDFRNIIHPKKEIVIQSTPYYQVFREKHGFQSDLSIVDLLFNMGNESILILLNSKKQTNIYNT